MHLKSDLLKLFVFSYVHLNLYKISFKIKYSNLLKLIFNTFIYYVQFKQNMCRRKINVFIRNEKMVLSKKKRNEKMVIQIAENVFFGS